MPDLLALHRERLAALDPWLPEAAPLPESVDSGRLIEVEDGAAHLDVVRSAPDSFTAIWAADESHVIRARVAGPAAMARLLGQWEEDLAQVSPGPEVADVEALTTWPSRDAAMNRPLQRHGFLPKVVLALRPAGRATAEGSTSARIRHLEDADLPAVVALWEQLVEWDNQFLDHPGRPGARELFREDLEPKDRRWLWVAEEDGEVVGMLLVSTPEDSGWVQPLVGPEPVSYLGTMMVAPSHRGGGLGAALVARAHEAADAAGIPALALHYSATSPLSGPFWHRSGYRPLWTTWSRSLHRRD